MDHTRKRVKSAHLFAPRHWCYYHYRNVPIKDLNYNISIIAHHLRFQILFRCFVVETTAESFRTTTRTKQMLTTNNLSQPTTLFYQTIAGMS